MGKTIKEINNKKEKKNGEKSKQKSPTLPITHFYLRFASAKSIIITRQSREPFEQEQKRDVGHCCHYCDAASAPSAQLISPSHKGHPESAGIQRKENHQPDRNDGPPHAQC